MAVKFLTDLNVDGTTMGQTAAEKISFYGATPIVQPSVVAALVTTPATTDIATAVNAIITNLQNLGLQASS